MLGAFLHSLWDGGITKDLGTLGWGTFSQAHGINDAGQIVGTSFDRDGSTHAATWNNGILPISIPTPGVGATPMPSTMPDK